MSGSRDCGTQHPNTVRARGLKGVSIEGGLAFVFQHAPSKYLLQTGRLESESGAGPVVGRHTSCCTGGLAAGTGRALGVNRTRCWSGVALPVLCRRNVPGANKNHPVSFLSTDLQREVRSIAATIRTCRREEDVSEEHKFERRFVLLLKFTHAHEAAVTCASGSLHF